MADVYKGISSDVRVKIESEVYENMSVEILFVEKYDVKDIEVNIEQNALWIIINKFKKHRIFYDV